MSRSMVIKETEGNEILSAQPSMQGGEPMEETNNEGAPMPRAADSSFHFPTDNDFDVPNPDGKLSKYNEHAKCVLQQHNYYRQAVNLQPLKWKNGLAKLAYNASVAFRNASCTEWHREPFNTDHWVGENLYSMSRFPFFVEEDKDMCQQAKDGVDEWYKEIRYYTYPINGKSFTDCLPMSEFWKYGHFIQMMWQPARGLGCSYASCMKMDEQWGIEMPKIIVNCYYDTPILLGRNVYTKWIANKLNAWEENQKYGGLKMCNVTETE